MSESGNDFSVLDEYQHFLMELDTWFRSIRVKYGSRMHCGKGCTYCCMGLFDIPIADALRVAAGFHSLSPSTRGAAVRQARAIHAGLLREAPGLEEPFFLDRISEESVDRLTELFDDVRCPFLAADGDCLVYEFRPSACILEGIPMVDVRDGPFDDWCEFNFAGGVAREAEADLRLDYYEIEATIRRVSQCLLERLPSHARTETTVFIPSIVVAFESFWLDRVREQL